MSKRLDAALSALDVGLQTPRPDPSFGELSPRVSDRCARCDRVDAASESEFCAPCRAFLLGDGPDPLLPARGGVRFVADYSFPQSAVWDRLQEVSQRLVTATWEAVTPVLDWWTANQAVFVAAGMANPDRSLTFGIAACALDPAWTEFGWAHLSHEVSRNVYRDTAAFPTTTVSVVPGDDPLRVVVLVEWSSLDPALSAEVLDVEVVRDSELSRTNQFAFASEWVPRVPVGFGPHVSTIRADEA